jgi:hypothetical protein
MTVERGRAARPINGDLLEDATRGMMRIARELISATLLGKETHGYEINPALPDP